MSQCKPTPNILKHAFARGRALEHVLSTVNSPGKSPEMQTSGRTATICICRRQKQKILCRSCGHVFDGRVRKKCILHPNEIHLMDQLCCPLCKTTYLQEIGGFSQPAGEESDNNNNATVGMPSGDINNNNSTINPASLERQTSSDRILLQQLSKKVNKSSTENWDDDLLNSDGNRR